jgi:hypothetical protein
MLEFLVEGAFFSALSTKSKIAYVAGSLILMLCFGAMIRYIDADLASDVALRNACESSPRFASPARLFEHFPEGSYSGRCLPDINTCGEFTAADGKTRHYPCKNGQCTMYWQLDGDSCRIQLNTNDHKARGAGDFKTAKGRWKSLQ